MNKKGQVIIYALMIGMVILILALSFIPSINIFTSNARNTTSQFGGLDCNNQSISDYNKAACLSTDLTMPIFIGILIFIGGAVITVKYIIS